MSTAQLSLIINKLHYDSERLNIARFSFPYVTDKENFVNVEKSIRKEKNIKKLRRYIQRHY